MTLPRTRCKKCVNTNVKVTQELCNKCAEIQYGIKNFDNHFLEESKNLMKED